MGNCNANEMIPAEYTPPGHLPNVTSFVNENEVFYNWKRDDFTFIKPIGKGGFGKVWLVQRKFDGAVFAIKEMFKARILGKRSIHSVINERKLLSWLKDEFIVNMLYAF